MSKLRLLCGASLILIYSIVGGSSEALEQIDLSIGLKTLPLLSTKLSGAVVMAIIFDPANAASKSEADQLQALLGSGLDAPGGVRISGMLVPISDLAKLSQAKLAFVTTGNKGAFDAIAAASAGILTMSTDLDCVRSNKCVLGIVSKPSVTIFYSRAAADAAKISFAEAFAMLAKLV